jgi:hypothetical protein
MITRRTFIAAVATAVAAGLAGCSDSSGSDRTASSAVTVTPYSLSHSERQLWLKLERDADVEKDEAAYLYVFENGKLISRSISSVKIGDLRDKSDEEVESAFAESDQAFVDAYPTETQAEQLINYYAMDEPYDISATIVETDGTGNNAKSEKLRMDGVREKTTQYTPAGALPMALMETLTLEFELPSSFDKGSWTVYEDSYGGFRVSANQKGATWFVTRLNQSKTYAFELDAPGTEGIQTE